MDGEAVENIERIVLKAASLVEVGGKQWARGGSGTLEVVIYDPQPKKIAIASLQALLDYINTEESASKSDILVVIEGPTQVHVGTKINKDTMSRRFFIGASISQKASFPFGEWLDVETFLIKLRSLFKDTSGRQKVLEFAARISSGSSIDLQDDGVSQNVTMKQGVSGALKANEVAPAVVTLQPYRTFREIEQPASEFIFRVKNVGDKVVCALFEADGGAWELEAIKRIKEWLNGKIQDVTILA